LNCDAHKRDHVLFLVQQNSKKLAGTEIKLNEQNLNTKNDSGWGNWFGNFLSSWSKGGNFNEISVDNRASFLVRKNIFFFYVPKIKSYWKQWC
jgi:hypothetical protein